MSIEALLFIALLAIAGLGWWLYRRKTAAASQGEGDSDLERPDHVRAHEIAKAQADLQRWSGPH